MTWSIQHQLPGTTAAERLAAWTYFKDTFIPGLGGWTKTAAHDDVADPSKFSTQRTVFDLVSGQNRPEGTQWSNSNHGSGDWQQLVWVPYSYTNPGEVPTDPTHNTPGSASSTANISSHLTPVDPSHEGFNFCVSDQNDHAFLITYNRKLFCMFLGFQQAYHWADDGPWFLGTRTGFRQAPYERPIPLGNKTATVCGGTEPTPNYSDFLVPGISYYPVSGQIVDTAWAGFPWESTPSSDTDDDYTCVFGTLPNTDVAWVRPYDFPYNQTTGQTRYLFDNNDEPFQVVRTLNGNYQLFWRDATLSQSFAMFDFGTNDPTA